jgi:hypothetical protein
MDPQAVKWKIEKLEDATDMTEQGSKLGQKISRTL